MAVTKVDVYAMAVRHLGDARLATITDDVETRYELDAAWDRAVPFVLRQAPWRFAMNTLALVPDPAALLPGYANGYSRPADWLRTHAIFLVGAAGQEHPFDLREQGAKIFTNSAVAPAMRFISNNFVDPAFAPWPEQFAQVVAAYLAFLVAERVTGERSAPGRMSQLFSSLLPEAATLDAVAEDPWLDAQRDGTFLRVARTMTDQGFWRFAMKTALMTPLANTGIAGFTLAAAIPDDWSRTRQLFVLTGSGVRRPFDVREQAGFWFTNATAFYAQYVSSTLAMDSTKWPDHYRRAVLRQIHFDRETRKDVSGPGYAQVPPEQAAAGAAWKDALADTIDSEADDDDPWLQYQLDGSFLPAVLTVLRRGNWRFMMKTVQFDASMQATDAPDIGFPYNYALPSDWFSTRALYIAFGGEECPFDIRETDSHWSTFAEEFTARYMTRTVALDATQWPQPVAEAVLAYLDWQSEPDRGGKKDPPAEEQQDATFYEKILADAMRELSLPDHPWLRFQLAGTYMPTVRMLLEKGRWRFAVETKILNPSSDPTGVSDGSPSAGYTYRFNKPNDWMRTLQVYWSLTEGWSLDGFYPERRDIDFRDELDGIHTNYTPVVMRYVSRLGLDSTRWSAGFRDAVLAFLQFIEARADPRLAAAHLASYKFQEEAAETTDDELDMPRIVRTGRFVSARYRRGGQFAISGSGRGSLPLVSDPNLGSYSIFEDTDGGLKIRAPDGSITVLVQAP